MSQTVKKRLETLNVLLTTLCLLSVLFSSCAQESRMKTAIKRIVQLEEVVEQVAIVNGCDVE